MADKRDANWLAQMMREIPAHRDSWICKLAMCFPVAETEITDVRSRTMRA